MALLALVLAVSGCAAPAAPAPDAISRTDGAAAVKKLLRHTDGGEFTFTGWSLNEGASRDVIMGYVDAYAAESGATVNDVAFPWGETLNQLVLQANGGTAEGAAQLDIAWLNTLAATGNAEGSWAVCRRSGLSGSGAGQRPGGRRRSTVCPGPPAPSAWWPISRFSTKPA